MLETLVLSSRATFIAHRLSTIAHANIILVMEAGRAVERGEHDELMRARGTYYGMVTRQREAMAMRE